MIKHWFRQNPPLVLKELFAEPPYNIHDEMVKVREVLSG